MLSLHIAKDAVPIQDYWPTDEAVQIEYSGEEGANIHFTDSATGRGVRIEMAAELIEAMYWLYMEHHTPIPPREIEVIEAKGPF